MARLIAKTPAAGLLPIEFGGARLDEVTVEAITWVAPFDQETSDIGLPLPAPGEVTANETHRALWFGSGQALVIGPPVAPKNAAHADQSSGFAILTLSGPAARDVLARLTPLDLRDAALAESRTARTLIGHMTASLTRVGPDAYEIMVFRSMAVTIVHELTRAMQAVAARSRL